MKHSFIKEILRDFLRNKSRFFSIVAIVALGAGFFGGIKATSIDMKQSIDAYYKENNLMDMRVMSTLGLTDDDMQTLSSLDGVEKAAGAYQYDTIIFPPNPEDAGEAGEHVVRIRSITEGINNSVLVEGRMPTAANEAVLVLNDSVPPSCEIGDTMKVNVQSDPDAEDSLTETSFQIVGYVKNPLYLSSLSNSTTKGSGKVSSFLFTLPEAFSMEAYTEVYLATDFSKELFTFGSSYEKEMDSLENEVESVSADACERRRDELIGPAEEELDKATKQYEEGKKQAEEELSKGEQALAEAEKKLADGKNQWELGKSELDLKISEGELQLSKTRTLLDESQKTLEESKVQLDAVKQQLDDGKVQLEQGEQLFQAALTGWETSKKLLDDVYESESTAKIRLEEAQTEYDRVMAESPEDAALVAQAKRDLLFAQAGVKGYEELAKAKTELDKQGQTLQEKRAEWETGNAQYLSGLSEYQNGAQKLADGERQYTEGMNTLLQQKTEGLRVLNNSLAEIQQGEKELEENKALFAQKKAETEQKLSDAHEQLLDAQTKIDDVQTPTWYTQTRATDTVLSGFEQDADRVDAVAAVFPVFFFLVAALVCLTTMTRMIEEQRTQIGVLKALGYTSKTIIAKYLIFAAVTTFIGCVVGLSVGFVVFPRVIWKAYSIMYTTPPIQTPFNWPLALLASAVFFAATILAAVAACYKELKEVPAGLIRPKPPKNGKRVFLERIPFIWGHLSFTQKLTMRNILRDKKRFFMTLIGVAGCTALMLTGFGLKDSITGIVSSQFNDLYHYDLNVVLNHVYSPEEPTERQQQILDLLHDSSEVKQSMIAAQEQVTATASNDESVDAYLFVPENEQVIEDFITFRDRRTKEALSFPSSGALITEKMADTLDLSVGDTISCKTSDGRTVSIPVEGITENYVYHYIYLSKSQYEQVFGGQTPEYRAIFVQTEEGADLSALSEQILENKEILSVTQIDTMTQTFNDMFDRLNLIIVVLILSASLLAFVVLYNLTNINITERIREIATIKVLGFFDKEVDLYVFRENMILSLLGMILGCGLGILLHQFVVTVAEVDMVMFHRTIAPLSYVYALLLTLVFTLAVQAAMHPRLTHVSMVESLKSVE